MGLGARRYALIIPALDEAESIGLALAQVPPGLFSQVTVVDNGSKDGTPGVARAAGAEVVLEPRRGYGQACLTGLAHLQSDVIAVAFMDADLADDPAELTKLAQCFEDLKCDLIIGSRVLGTPQPGSLTPVQRFGNWLATRLIRLIWRVKYTDLGPLRMVSRQALGRMGLRDRDFGWNVEMQAKAAAQAMKVAEVPVNYRRRLRGRSKISGTIWGSTRAGFKILWTLYRCWRQDSGRRRFT